MYHLDVYKVKLIIIVYDNLGRIINMKRLNLNSCALHLLVNSFQIKKQFQIIALCLLRHDFSSIVLYN